MNKISGILVLALSTLQCGKNLDILNPVGGVTPPQNVMAYSSDSQAVTLTWTAPPEVSDSTFSDYVIRWNSLEDSVGKGTLSYTANLVPAGGVTSFQLYSRLKSGDMSTTPSVIQWAPAQRYSGASFTIWEYVQSVSPGGPTAIYLGGEGGNPVRSPIDSTLSSDADFYLFGGTGGIQQALQLNSPDLYSGTNNPTRFSTVTNSSTTLNYPLASFPGVSTFTQQSVQVNANTIYYLQLQAANGSFRYARVLVLATPTNTFPDRSITFQVSVQREPGVTIARSFPSPGADHAMMGALFPFPR